MSLFSPKITLRSVHELDIEKIKTNGIKGIIFDIDNTLAYNREKEPNKQIITLIEELKENGLKVALASNNTRIRVESFNQKLNLHCEFRSLKPLPFKINRILKMFNLKPEEVCLVGDQIFTDILGGNLRGLFTVLVEPFDDDEEKFIKFKRKIEKLFK